MWLREPARAGLRDDTAAVLPNALEVRIDPEFAAPSSPGRPDPAALTRTPGQLFADYCAAQPVPVRDERVAALFAQLHDEVTASVSGDGPA